MRKCDVDRELGKRVKVRLFDGSEYTGTLHQSGEEMFKADANLYLPRRYYFLADGMECTSPLFRCSHIKKITAGL